MDSIIPSMTGGHVLAEYSTESLLTEGSTSMTGPVYQLPMLYNNHP